MRLSRRHFLGSLAFGAFAVACGGSTQTEPVSLNEASENTTLGPGDIFRLEIVGEADLPTEFQVANDGTVTFPYVGVKKVSGLEPQKISSLVREALIEKKILTDPTVVVSVTAYRSKTVVILGEVQSPGSFPLGPAMTLVQAISMAGGFTAVAQKGRVNLSRSTNGKANTVVIDVESIYEGKSEDILLQAGDRIYVHERVF